ncbi:proline dehydrogenase family protein [Rossellomorea marisflavi]|uniref:proline dehydrogenase family protein n=1 Tax=Rossellomorea marisflavi TaxID=189381 RepID=UPI00345D137B
MYTSEKRFSNSLKSIARDQHLKTYLQNSSELYPLLAKGAKRFVAGERREDGLVRAKEFHTQGHAVSLEYIGENTITKEECVRSKEEFKGLITDLGRLGMKATVSFDLSHIGMMVSDDLAFIHLEELASAAAKNGISLMISMEESQKTDRILSLYKRISKTHSNVGITLQVHLNRTSIDLQDILSLSGNIRLVKGAYQEGEEQYIPRSSELNNRYIHFVTTCLEHDHPISVATHDETILTELKKKDLLRNPRVEVEMLDGVRPDLLRRLHDEDVNTKVYVTYGSEWYLYVVHRIAEYPPNIYTFISDVIEESM